MWVKVNTEATHYQTQHGITCSKEENSHHKWKHNYHLVPTKKNSRKYADCDRSFAG